MSEDNLNEFKDLFNEWYGKQPKSKDFDINDGELQNINLKINQLTKNNSYSDNIYDELFNDQIQKEFEYTKPKRNSDFYDQVRTLSKKLDVNTPIFEAQPSDIPYNSNILGSYFPDKHQIVINPKTVLENKTPYGVVTHELGHAADRKLLFDDKPWNKDTSIPKEYFEFRENHPPMGSIKNSGSLKKDFDRYMLNMYRNRLTEIKDSPLYRTEEHSFRHHSVDNPIIEKLAKSKEAADYINATTRSSFEQRGLLALLLKNGFLKSISGLSSISNLPGSIKDYYNASKDPNITDEEKYLRIMNAIYPNESMEKDIEQRKMIRDSLHI